MTARHQDSLMLHDPATGSRNPYPSHAAQYRKYWGAVAWLVDPWTAERRDAHDVGSDPFGLAIVPPTEVTLND